MNKEETPNIDPFGIIGRALYDVLNGATQTVGLTPVEVLMGAGGILGAILAVQFLISLTGKRGWTLYDSEQEEAPSVVEGIPVAEGVRE